MTRRLSSLLQIAVVLIGVGVLAFLLWEPHIEGRNAHATAFEIYFKDPFLAYVYLASIPFFIGLHRAFQLFGHIRRTASFSQATVDSLRAIQRCALLLIGFILGAVLIILMSGDPDDRPAGCVMCLLATFGATAVAVLATVFARALENTLGQ